jgi:acyl carrier protein
VSAQDLQARIERQNAFFKELERQPVMPELKYQRPELENTYVAPDNKAEKTIATVWQKALNVEKVGIYDNFFDLGGHSLLLMEVFGELQRFFKQELSMIDMFKYPTVKALADYLSQKKRDLVSLPRSNDSTDHLNQGKDRLKRLYKHRQQMMEKQQGNQDE